MNNSKIVRAWKDEEYRNNLSTEERAFLPESPIGEVALTDTELTKVNAGYVFPPTAAFVCPVTIQESCLHTLFC